MLVRSACLTKSADIIATLAIICSHSVHHLSATVNMALVSLNSPWRLAKSPRISVQRKHIIIGSYASRQSARFSASQARQQLLEAVVKQFRNETLPMLQELAEPFLQGPPAPLTDTVHPQELADPDSKFVEISLGVGKPIVNIHYKYKVPNGTSTCDKPTIVMMHGFNGSEFNWRLVMDDLVQQTGCRVVAYDRPPFGLSSRPLYWDEPADNPYTLESGAEHAKKLMDLLGISNAVLVGHSAGAPVAVEVALRYPELVSGLVLVGPAITTDSKGFLSRLDLGQLARFALTRAILNMDGPGLNYVRKQIKKRSEEVKKGKFGVYYDEGNVPQEVINGYLRPMKAHDWDRASLQVFRNFSLGSPPSFERVAAPVMVVQGEEDRAVPKAAGRAVARRFTEDRTGGTTTEYLEMPQVGHLPMEESPAAFSKAVSAFVNTHCVQCTQMIAAAADGINATSGLDAVVSSSAASGSSTAAAASVVSEATVVATNIAVEQNSTAMAKQIYQHADIQSHISQSTSLQDSAEQLDKDHSEEAVFPGPGSEGGFVRKTDVTTPL